MIGVFPQPLRNLPFVITVLAGLATFAPCDASGMGGFQGSPQGSPAGQAGQGAAAGEMSVTRVARVGAVIVAGSRGARGVSFTIVVPADWPEQHVAMFEENLPDTMRRTEYHDAETIREFTGTIPQLPARETVELEILFDVTVKAIPYPERTDQLVVPDRPPRDIRLHLSPSELIESRKPAIRKQAEEIIGDEASAWEQARLLYEWVVTNIEIDKSLDETGANEALANRKGSIEDRTYLFIALLRSQDIPARVVWADQGEYAEFYLQDDTGAGRWYPAVLEGKPEFGQMTNPRVIWQKGDNIKSSGRSKRMMYVLDKVDWAGSAQSIRCRWIRDVLPARPGR